MPEKHLPKIEYKSVKDLIYDPENPRLPKSVDGSDEDEVINWMLSNENVVELMASIAEEGYFQAEPLLVAPGKKGKFIVVEGNRRLTAVKLLLNPEKATSKKNTIQELVDEAKSIKGLGDLPVIVFKDSEEIQQYLGYRHITGVQPWDSLAKARYLRRMQMSIGIRNLNELYKSLAKIIGSRADHVKLLLTGLDVYEVIEENSFFNIKGLDEKSVKFGVLYTAINKPNIAYFIGVDFDSDRPAKRVNTKTLKELSQWMFEKNSEGITRLGESRNLQQLSKIVAPEHKKALKAFRLGKSLADAVLLTDEPQEIFKVSLNDALNKLQVARDYIHLIDEVDQSDEETLSEITKLSRTISATVKAKTLEKNED
jgi:hypothetical protein